MDLAQGPGLTVADNSFKSELVRGQVSTWASLVFRGSRNAEGLSGRQPQLFRTYLEPGAVTHVVKLRRSTPLRIIHCHTLHPPTFRNTCPTTVATALPNPPRPLLHPGRREQNRKCQDRMSDNEPNQTTDQFQHSRHAPEECVATLKGWLDPAASR